MRRWTLSLPLTAALPVAALLLAACSSSSGGGASSTASGSHAGGTALPTVTGAFGTEPKVTLPSSAAPTSLRTSVLQPGTGPVVVKGDLVAIDYVGEIWKSGKVFDSSFGTGRTPAAFPIGTGAVIPGFDTGIVGKTSGSRVLLVIPPAQGYGSAGNQQAGIGADDTLVFVVDVLGTTKPGAGATGTAAPAGPADQPSVTTKPGVPTITVPKSAAPKSLVGRTVLAGTGDTVAKGDLIVVQYVGVLWASGKVFDSSWSRGTPAGFGIGVGQVIKGWDHGLVGHKVGDRVLLVVPPAEGYGSQGQSSAGISGSDTLVFAVDIVGTYH